MVEAQPSPPLIIRAISRDLLVSICCKLNEYDYTVRLRLNLSSFFLDRLFNCCISIKYTTKVLALPCDQAWGSTAQLSNLQTSQSYDKDRFVNFITCNAPLNLLATLFINLDTFYEQVVFTLYLLIISVWFVASLSTIAIAWALDCRESIMPSLGVLLTITSTLYLALPSFGQTVVVISDDPITGTAVGSEPKPLKSVRIDTAIGSKSCDD